MIDAGAQDADFAALFTQTDVPTETDGAVGEEVEDVVFVQIEEMLGAAEADGGTEGGVLQRELTLEGFWIVDFGLQP